MDTTHDSELMAALDGFNKESILYCRGINDGVARQYAVEYAEMIAQQASGLEAQPPKKRHQLFAPTRRLICSTLEEMRERYFPSK